MANIEENSDKKKEIIIGRIESTVNKLKNKDFTLYFFVVDSRNMPSGKISYIYQLAKTLQDKGYNVCMLYQMIEEYTKEEIEALKKEEKPLDERKQFIGVGDWMGEEYGNLPHMNIAKEEWRVGPADFLFIPEVFSTLMAQTFKNKIPCKRIILLENFEYITEYIQPGMQWANYGVRDAICVTKQQEALIRDVFPYMRTRVLNPYISDCFRKPVKPKKLIVSIVSMSTDDVNRIVKPFYWKYPNLQFVSFKDLRGFPRSKYAEFLKESCITIWVDKDTPFGYAPLEAMKCGNIVIGKMPEYRPEWMSDFNYVECSEEEANANKSRLATVIDGKVEEWKNSKHDRFDPAYALADGKYYALQESIRNNAIWFEDIHMVPQILARLIGSWMQDELPEVIEEEAEKTNSEYTYERWVETIDKMMPEIIEERIKEIRSIQVNTRNSNSVHKNKNNN